MLVLRILFIVLCLVSLACGVRGLMYKRKNIGFLILSVMVAVADIFSFVLLNVQNAKDATNILLPYYILHAWSLFVFLVMITLIDRGRRRYIFAMIISGLLCIYQTFLIIMQYRGSRLIIFQKRVYFRKAFWVAADDSKNSGLFFSFRTYRILTYINIAIIILLLIGRLIKTHSIFRSRYYGLIGMSVAFTVAEALKTYFSFPVWIPCLAYNFVVFIGLYYTGKFAKSRLREWSLDSFANDMSDGLILYDKHNDLIHLNDMIKIPLDEELIERFKDRDRLEDWLDDNRDEKNDKIIIYSGGDRDYYFKVNVRALGGENDEIGTLYMLHDTTDSILQIKLMEKANEELERASQMKSDFLANMSHEIRTPMNAVIGMAEIAMRDRDPRQITDYLLQIQRSGKNLLNIINDILDYSKIESGKMEIIEEDYEPATELTDIANILSTRIGDKKLELFFLVETAIPHVLRGDAMRIRQVLINLANNAIKFTNQGLVRVNVRVEPSGEGMVNMNFHVIDTGIGIKKEDLDKLFESFQQVDSKRNRSVEGTGLGLAISKKLVEAMNGEIGVESEYGKGSDFYFTIPQKVVDPTDDILVNDTENKHAFVIDEEGGMRKVFINEMARLKVSATAITSVDEYKPTGKKDFVFFKKDTYSDKIRAFLDAHKDVNGVILVGDDVSYATDRENLKSMHRPLSTMGMASMLNGTYDETAGPDEDKLFRPDFIAPDAKVLVVDDNKINLTIAEGLLLPLKLQIDTADGGQEAIDKVMANEYDLVFMDHMMPEIDGVDATKQIRAAGEGSHQPVIIALSANVMGEAKTLFVEAGMNDFVAKPIDVRKLCAVIKKWLKPEKIIKKDGSEDENDSEDEVIVKIPGLDIDNAVRALGSVPLYNKIAGEYYRSGADRLNSIKEAYDNEDWTDYTIKVHALKSSSRQIGAMELGQMAADLEEAGKDNNIDKIKAETGKTLETFDELLKKLAEFYETEEEEDTQDKPLIETAELLEFMSQLETACDELDSDVLEEIDNKLKGYSYEYSIREEIIAMHKAVADIDTDECVEIITRIRGKIQ